MRLMVLDLARLNLCMSSVGGKNVHHTTDTAAIHNYVGVSLRYNEYFGGDR